MRTKTFLAGYLRRAGQDILAQPLGNTAKTRRTDPYPAIDVFILCACPALTFLLFMYTLSFPPFFVALHFASRFAIQFLVSHFSIHSNLD
jgi:hypothetical protein